MMNGLRLNKWVLIAAAAVVILLAAWACGNMFRNYVSIRGQHLNSYSYSEGGGMVGAYHSESVKRSGDRALITIESARWHSQDPTVEEYLTDAAVLDELEAVVRKYHMNFWHRKEFTNVFVADGDSKGYHFDFDEETVWFSSQIYPARYRNKLAELDRVLDQYIAAGEKLPGLVNPRSDDGEDYFLPEDELLIYVFSYAGNSLGLRILNGTNGEVEIPDEVQLISADTGAVLFEEQSSYIRTFSERSRDEMHIELQDRLPAGNYILRLGGMDIPFEIR